MKKILLVISIILYSDFVMAATICSKSNGSDDIVVNFFMDPSVAGESYVYDEANKVWSTRFKWGVISGYAMCSAYGTDSSTGKVFSMGKTEENLEDKGASITGVEKRYCWCKMTHPAASLWVFGYDAGSLASCASHCASSCGDNARDNSALRVGLFGSVVN